MKKIGIVAVISFIVDRVVKIIVDSSLKPFFKYKIIGNFLYLLNCRNTGAAFSLFSGATVFLIFFTIIALYLIINFLRKEKEKSNLLSIAYGMLIGGILGNLFDRIVYGSVIDFIGIRIIRYSFPVFNIADMLIVISAFIIIMNEFGGETDAESSSN